MRLRTTDYVLVDGCHISKPTPTPNVTSFNITIEGVTSAIITNSTIKDARVGVYSVDNFSKTIRIVNNTIENIGVAVADINYCTLLTITANTFNNFCTTTTSAVISGIYIDVGVFGFVIANNVFGANSAQYLIRANTATNGEIHGNLFQFINTGASNDAAVLERRTCISTLIPIS